MNSPIIYVRLPEPLKKEVAQLAKKEYQTVSTMLRMLVREALTARKASK
jgi:hypothetical protein